MVLRGSDGTMIVAACRQLTACADTLKAELAAIEEGLTMALHWTTVPIVLKSDCMEAINLIAVGAPNLSRYAMRVSNIRDSIKEREIAIAKVSRVANLVSHSLAALGRVQERNAVWLQNPPSQIADAIMADCNILFN
jgi:hypothetical protein